MIQILIPPTALAGETNPVPMAPAEHQTGTQSVNAPATAPVEGHETTRSDAAQPAPGAPDIPAMAETADLFLAIRRGDDAALRKLLDRKADPNRVNWLGYTPLMWAANRGNLSAARILLNHGADLRTGSPYGSALTAATMSRNAAVVKLLLDRGADPHPFRADGMTPLMIAAYTKQEPMVRLLLEKETDPERTDMEGMTALMHAARSGSLPITRLLLARGARTTATDKRGWTAATYAKADGFHNVADLLRGHEPSSRSVVGKTPARAAVSTVSTPLRTRLLPAASHVTQTPGSTVSRIALEKTIVTSLNRLEGSMRTFTTKLGCVSCHHAGLGLMTTGLARAKGISIDGELSDLQIQRIKEQEAMARPLYEMTFSNPQMAKVIPAVDINDYNLAEGYWLNAVSAHGSMNGDFTPALRFLARQQSADGRWNRSMPRGPMQVSDFTVTALVVRALRDGMLARSVENDPEIERSLRRARFWLESAKPASFEDSAARLLGLSWSGAGSDAIQRAANHLLRLQRRDGGWQSTDSLKSDAFATGQALYTLRTAANLPRQSTPLRRGMEFLLRSRKPDGTWYMTKTANPYNFHSDSDFPYGKAQYASFNATCWATMGLLEMLPPNRGAAVARRK